MTNSAHVKFLGTTDEHTTCDCCGRKDLKSTVALSIDDADPVFFGVTCAARALNNRGVSMTAAEVRKGASAADRAKEAARIAAEKAAYDAARPQREAEQAAWFAWLAANGTGNNHFDQVQSLGGFKAAKALYAASKG